MPDFDATADDGHATWAQGYDEGRRHGHKECHDEIARLRAEVERLGHKYDRALIALGEIEFMRPATRQQARAWCAAIEAGADPDAGEGEGETR